MRQHFTSTECPTCGTLFEQVPVEEDDEGNSYAALKLKYCTACNQPLCSSCDQFQCDVCDQPACLVHLVTIPDGTPAGLHCCPACARGAENLNLDVAREAYSDGGELLCEDCGGSCHTHTWNRRHQIWIGECCRMPKTDPIPANYGAEQVAILENIVCINDPRPKRIGPRVATAAMTTGEEMPAGA